MVGPAVAHHGWTPTSYDELAGAVVAGHVIECGAQATGGNFSGFRQLVKDGMDPAQPLGFPIAEIAADGSSVITKHDGTGGAVTVDTVTAQLVYEIQTTRYLNPDVTARLDTDPARAGRARTGSRSPASRGEAPPERLKVCVNELGGFRNQVEFVLTGLDVEEKAEWVREQLTPALTAAGRRLVAGRRCRRRTPTPRRRASALLRCTVMDPQPDPVGRAFTGPAVELALASYPGFTMTTPPQQPTPYGVYRPEYVDRAQVQHTVVHADGRREEIADPTDVLDRRPRRGPAPVAVPRPAPTRSTAGCRSAPSCTRAPATRAATPTSASGSPTTATRAGEARVTWLAKMMSPRRVRELIPEARDLEVDVYVLPNLGGVNVVVHGLLGQGVAASTRFDPQAKGLGEWLRSRVVHIQEELCDRRREHRAIRELGAEFVRREVAPHLQEWEDAGSIPRELHLTAGKQGLLGVAFPEEVGGGGGTLLDSVDLQEAMFDGGRVQRADGRAVHRRHRAAAHRGEPATPTWSTGSSARPWPARRSARSRSPSPAAAPTSPASGPRRCGEGDHYVVNGAKTFITSGVRADFVTTAVRTGGPGHARRHAARRRGRHARVHRRPVAAQDGLALLRHRRAVVRRRAGPGRQPGRRGEHRLRPDRRAVRGRADRAGRARLRHRGPLARARPRRTAATARPSASR